MGRLWRRVWSVGWPELPFGVVLAVVLAVLAFALLAARTASWVAAGYVLLIAVGGFAALLLIVGYIASMAVLRHSTDAHHLAGAGLFVVAVGALWTLLLVRGGAFGPTAEGADPYPQVLAMASVFVGIGATTIALVRLRRHEGGWAARSRSGWLARCERCGRLMRRRRDGSAAMHDVCPERAASR